MLEQLAMWVTPPNLEERVERLELVLAQPLAQTVSLAEVAEL
jgi:hypothetical protein